MTKDKVQNIMKSQFIYSYGPGAIIESVNGPRLIPSLQRGLKADFTKIRNKYVEENLRLNNLLLNDNKNLKKKFFKLPSNASEQKKENEGLYKTYIFPVWKICYGNHPNKKAVLFKSGPFTKNCPKCEKQTDTHVRFICACPSGHMDEVPWNEAIHNDDKDSSCYPEYFIWDANGSSLENINIICPDCGERKNMAEIYGQYHHCTGRTPEKERAAEKGNVIYSEPKYGKCSNNMAIIQRQSTSLRIVNTTTLLKIPVKEVIEDLFVDQTIVTTLNNALNIINNLDIKLSKEQFLSFIIDNDEIEEYKKNLITNYIMEDGSYLKLLEKFQNYKKNPDINKKSLDDIKIEEYEFLIKPSTYDEFYVGPSESPKDFSYLKISPVEKLPLITAQLSYQRKPYPPKNKKTKEYEEPKYVSTGERIMNEMWYPVYDSVGEGIFISNTKNIPLKEKNIKEWNDSLTKKSEIQYRNPQFVWWHTLSHALIRTLSYDSGYSSASIRERIYYNPSNNKGGILLYTTSTGEDGGMGGLVSMANPSKFNEILKKSFELIETCSYDPLCSDSTIKKGKVNGSACIYCLLLSETSCDYNNKWLDRHVLLGD